FADASESGGSAGAGTHGVQGGGERSRAALSDGERNTRRSRPPAAGHRVGTRHEPDGYSVDTGAARAAALEEDRGDCGRCGAGGGGGVAADYGRVALLVARARIEQWRHGSADGFCELDGR